MDTLGRAIVTLAAVTLMVMRVGLIESSMDGVNSALLIIAVVPWLLPWFGTARSTEKLTAQFQQIQQEQEKQKEELDRLHRLAAIHVTQDEQTYLSKLVHKEPFVFARDALPNYFETEIRRLLANGFLRSKPGKGVQTLLAEGGEVSEHVDVTDRGREYVQLQDELTAIRAQQPGG